MVEYGLIIFGIATITIGILMFTFKNFFAHLNRVNWYANIVGPVVLGHKDIGWFKDWINPMSISLIIGGIILLILSFFI